MNKSKSIYPIRMNTPRPRPVTERVGEVVLNTLPNRNASLRTPNQKRRLGSLAVLTAAGALVGGVVLLDNLRAESTVDPAVACAVDSLNADSTFDEAVMAVNDCLSPDQEVHLPQLEDMAQEALVLVSEPADHN